MYKYYRKGNTNIMEYDFDSITEFLNYIENTPVSSSFDGRRLASEDNDYGFTKTRSLDQAKEYV